MDPSLLLSAARRAVLRRLLLGLERLHWCPPELPPKLGPLILGKPSRVRCAAYGLAVRARRLVQAAVEHVADLMLEPVQLSPAQSDYRPGDDLAHIAGRLAVRRQHAPRLLSKVASLPVRQVEAGADDLAGLAEEAVQGELVV